MPAEGHRSPFVSFLTDFGGDNAVAVCRGVIWGIVPDAAIDDVTHAVAKFDVRAGAFLLACAVPYLPVGVHLAVVDPGVGTARRPIAVRAARGDVLVGPDNGLLRPAAEALGGATAAHALTNRALWRETVSTTFHGRDIFAPVAAHLAAGTPLDEVGDALDLEDLVDLRLPSARRSGEALESAVLHVDSFGNVRIAGGVEDLAAVAGAPTPGRRFRVALPDGRIETLPWALTFGEVAPGEAILYEDADYGGLGLAVNQGSAAERFGLAVDGAVRVEPA